MQFTHEWLPQRVVFATGGAAVAVAEEVRRLAATRVMAIASDAARAELRRGVYRGAMAEYADDAALDTYYHDVLVR